MITVEKGQAAEPVRMGRPRKYPFPDMEVGDTITVDGSGGSCSATSAAHMYARKHRDKGIKFSARQAGPGKVVIVRVA